VLKVLIYSKLKVEMTEKTKNKLLQFDYKTQSIILPTAIITCVLSVFLYPTDEFLQVLFGSYFIVGGLQLISIISKLTNMMQWSVGRKIHSLIVFLLLIGLVPPLTFYTLLILLFSSPFLAVWYYFLTKDSFKEL